MVCHGLGSSVLQVGEWNATAEGTWEKVWARRRSKAPLLGRVRGGGADHHRNLPVHMSWDSQRVGASGRSNGWQEATCSGYQRPELLVQALVWTKGSMGLSATK